jgi:hypothetical protein
MIHDRLGVLRKGETKGEELYYKIEPSILGSLHSFNFFFGVMGQSNWFVARKKIKIKIK